MYTIKKLDYDNHKVILNHVMALLKELRDSPDEKAGVDERKVIEDWKKNLDRHTTFAAYDDKNIVGVITLSECFAIYANGSYGIINELFVVSEERSKGVGKLLLDEVISFACEQGWHRIDVAAPLGDKWQRTVDFYLREGFVHTGHKLKYMLS